MDNIPLHFFFNTSPGIALPIIAIPYFRRLSFYSRIWMKELRPKRTFPKIIYKTMLINSSY